MPKIVESTEEVKNEIPQGIRPYRFHGVRLDYREGDKEAIGDCPFCSRENKFFVNLNSGLYSCKVCGTGSVKGGGNPYTFLRELYKVLSSRANNYVSQFDSITRERRLTEGFTVRDWGLVYSATTGDFFLPGYGADGKINQLYRYATDPSTGKRRFLATPTLSHGIFRPLVIPKKPSVSYLCEGPWDGMALYETLRFTKDNGNSFLPTTNRDMSLGANAVVYAVPGCNTFRDDWRNLFQGTTLSIIYDSDHPKKVNGRVVPSAGESGMKRVCASLSLSEHPPTAVQAIRWGTDGYDPEKRSGYDLRDFLSEGEATQSQRSSNLQEILSKVSPIPDNWIEGRSKESKKNGSTKLELLECTSWKTLIQSWRKAMRWEEGLDRALSVMLSCIVSTKSIGDQLWVRVVGPASCGKSTLCEAISTNTQYVLPKSTFRGFHSGYRTDNSDSAEDNSLIPKLTGKTLVTKDGDTLLQSPNLSQILSEARDIYDSVSRVHYRNRIDRSYEGIRLTWILCGTSSLRSLDTSELGERFLTCIIMDGIDDEAEDEILWRVANRAVNDMDIESGSGVEAQNNPDLVEAMRLTGGYIDFLRLHANKLLSSVVIDDTAIRRCVALGKFVAHLRARPSTKQVETAEREFGARLVSQLIRLLKCMAVVLGETTVTEEVLRRTSSVALDTAKGRSLDIVKHLYSIPAGLEVRSIAILTNHGEDEERKLLKFMAKIGVVEPYVPSVSKGVRGKPRYRLTEKMRRLYRIVTEGEEKSDAEDY